MRKSKVIAITNQKGGVGKTVTSVSLGACLARDKKKVLIVDFDPQGSLTKGLGYRVSSSYPYSIKDVLFNEINETSMTYKDAVIHTDESFDLLPANISLSGADIQLSNVMSRETIFKRVIDTLKDDYDYVLIDNNPALNLFTINGLVAADSVIIPVQAEPYACDGLNDLLHTIATAKKQINPNLKIDGILITMTDARTNLSKHIANEVRENYGQHIKVFKTEIPRVVKTSEASLSGQSPVKYAPNSESTLAYQRLAIGLTAVYPTVKQLGLNAGMMLRLFLEKCKTVDEVIQLLNTLPIASSQTFTLVDTGGDIALIECNSKQIKINRNNQNAFATNWFFSEAMREYNNHLIDNWQAQKRYQTIKEAILTDKINDFNDAAALLSGRYGYICQYDRKTGKDTVWSVIYDVKNKRIFRVEGNPSRKSFMEDKRFKFK